MNEYKDYLKNKGLGLRDKANDNARAVVVTWAKNKDKDFAFRIVADANGQKINQLLFNGIVIDVIKGGLDADPKCIKCAIQCIQNIYGDKKLWASLSYVTEMQLCGRLIKLTPNDEWAKAKYIEVNLSWLAYCVHEWPSGILYGMDGANPDQCQEILNEISVLRGMVIDKKNLEFIASVEEKVRAYLIK